MAEFEKPRHDFLVDAFTPLSIDDMLEWQLQSNEELQGENRFLKDAVYAATHDPLTGLPNIVLFKKELASSIEQTPGNFGLIFFDLDDVKLVNDTMGHLAGDEYIKRAAEVLQSGTRNQVGRERDLVSIARWGGDEFPIIFRQISGDTLETIARRVQQELYANGIRASVGSAMHTPGETAEQIFARADAAMYLNKAERKGSANT